GGDGDRPGPAQGPEAADRYSLVELVRVWRHQRLGRPAPRRRLTPLAAYSAAASVTPRPSAMAIASSSTSMPASLRGARSDRWRRNSRARGWPWYRPRICLVMLFRRPPLLRWRSA